MGEEKNTGNYLKKQSVMSIQALTIGDVDGILNSLPKGELIAYRKSLEFYKERLLEQQRKCSVSFKNNVLLSSSIKGDHKAYNRRG